MRRWVSRVYGWAERSLSSRYGLAVFALLSFLNSSILPVSPYFMLVPMCLARSRRWLLYAAVGTVTSVLGGYVMWALGYFFWEGFEAFARAWLPFLNVETVPELAAKYRGSTFWGVVVAAFSPVPYKFVSLACGLAQVNLLDLTLASLLGRGFRLFATAYLVAFGGPRVQAWIVGRIGSRKPAENQ